MQAQASGGDPASRWQRIKAIFGEAIELREPQRAKYLEKACGGDAELREEVQKLLDQLNDGGESTELFHRTAGDSLTKRHTLGSGHLVSERFKIVRFVGQGGMGEVYEAQDTELGGRVAVKIVRPELLKDSSFLDRFRREVAIARQVTHPNVCRVFDVGSAKTEDGGEPCAYFTMEFLEGETLGQFLRRTGKLTTAAALPIAQQMASGLAALHAQGVVHRDFKPGNVMICQTSSGLPRAVINDFGLARAAEREFGEITRSGQVFGTPDYMAPEQLMGQPASTASDIYALGLILYEMVTGSKAFSSSGQVTENAVQRVTKRPRSPREKSPELPQSWEDAILACLSPDPDDRPRSAEDVAAALGGGQRIPTPAPIPTTVSGASSSWITPAIFLAILLALSVAMARYTGWIGEKTSQSDPASASVALLPLSVLTDEPELRVFAAGLMETMTSRMSLYETSNAGALLVVPASEVRSQEAKTAGDAKRKFSAAYAVEGSLQRSEDRLRLLLTVIDTRQMRQLETIQLEEPRGNPVKLQDTAVARLANALNLTLQAKHAGDSVSLASLAPGAYEYYLQARGYLQRSDQPQSVASAVKLFQRALEADPNYALAHSGLGEALYSQFQLSREPATLEAAMKSGRRGVELNPNLAETNVAMGRILVGTGQYEQSKAAFEKALAIDGRSAEALRGLASAHDKLGQSEKAEAVYLKAISLRPSEWSGYKVFGLHYLNKGEFDKAAEQFQKVIDLSPDNAEGYNNLGAAHFRANRLVEAEKLWIRALELEPNRVNTMNNLGLAYLRQKQYEKAIATYSKVTGLNPKGYRSWGRLGQAFAQTNRPKDAQEAYQKAIAILEAEILIDTRNARFHSLLSYYRALAHRTDYVVALERALDLMPKDMEVTSVGAEACALAGDRGRAVDLLARSFAAGYSVESARGSQYLEPLIAEAIRKQNKE